MELNVSRNCFEEMKCDIFNEKLYLKFQKQILKFNIHFIINSITFYEYFLFSNIFLYSKLKYFKIQFTILNYFITRLEISIF